MVSDVVWVAPKQFKQATRLERVFWLQTLSERVKRDDEAFECAVEWLNGVATSFPEATQPGEKIELELKRQPGPWPNTAPG